MGNLKTFLEKNNIEETDSFDATQLSKLLSDYSSMNNQKLSEKLKEEKANQMFIEDQVDLRRSVGVHINVLRDIVKSLRITNNYIISYSFWIAVLVIGIWGIMIIEFIKLIVG